MRAIFVGLSLLLVGCPDGDGTSAPTSTPRDAGSIAFQPCRTFCLRPDDCAVGYPSDELCPPGFLCAEGFACVTDGGPY